MPPVQVFRSGSVKADSANMRMTVEEPGKIVQYYRVVVNIGIKTACPYAGLQYIPQSDSCHGHGSSSGFVWLAGLDAKDFHHDFPECVSRMRIVLSCLERSLAGHCSQDQGV